VKLLAISTTYQDHGSVEKSKPPDEHSRRFFTTIKTHRAVRVHLETAQTYGEMQVIRYIIGATPW